MAAVSTIELELLQRLLVGSLTSRLKQDIEDEIPTDAATLGVIVKLLKDNAITADPADSDDLSELRAKLSAAAAARTKGNVGSVLSIAKAKLAQEA